MNCILTELTESMFEKNEDITTVEIADGIETIPNKCFYRCKNLKQVILPMSIKNINYFAFSMCENLECINIPSSVEYINPQAFMNCKHKGIVILDKDIVKKFTLNKLLYNYHVIIGDKYMGKLYSYE